ncbi:MAG: hypothetical protein F6K40_12220 [Okeania sp. SIO3I5]|uniref:hypothetical protein n=1 Tax=Okeania sp. SIO3I5 TaxID=2607805 RepID=UPI0013B9C2B5|nr:hypothetical protein [Okeania sp. SIO3I5]NEQ36995.1 hypothetical protein [Okeania sp. SIO3I5]
MNIMQYYPLKKAKNSRTVNFIELKPIIILPGGDESSPDDDARITIFSESDQERIWIIDNIGDNPVKLFHKKDAKLTDIFSEDLEPGERAKSESFIGRMPVFAWSSLGSTLLPVYYIEQ